MPATCVKQNCNYDTDKGFLMNCDITVAVHRKPPTTRLTRCCTGITPQSYALILILTLLHSHRRFPSHASPLNGVHPRKYGIHVSLLDLRFLDQLLERHPIESSKSSLFELCQNLLSLPSATLRRSRCTPHRPASDPPLQRTAASPNGSTLNLIPPYFTPLSPTGFPPRRAHPARQCPSYIFFALSCDARSRGLPCARRPLSPGR
jgi:hypothetical protein